MAEVKGILLDADYEMNASESIIRLFVRTAKGIEVFFDPSFKPYFYVIPAGKPEELLNELLKSEVNGSKALKGEVVERKDSGRVIKLVFNSTLDLVNARKEIKFVKGVRDSREYDIPFHHRYLIDRDLKPMASVKVSFNELDGRKIVKEIMALDEVTSLDELNVYALDIETLNNVLEGVDHGFPEPKKNAIIMASLANKEKLVLTYNKKLEGIEWIKVYADEWNLLNELNELIREKSPDLLLTYNGDRFDLPYIQERSKLLGLKLGFGIEGREAEIEKHGMSMEARLPGRQHIDVYRMMVFLNRVNAVSLSKLDLGTAYSVVFKEETLDFEPGEMNKVWENGTKKELLALAEYNKQDSLATMRLGKEFLGLFVEISKLVRQPLTEVIRESTGTMVEQILFIKANKRNELIPNRPEEEVVKGRQEFVFKGAFVKEPLPGIHENLAALDYKSFHPSIVISHNIGLDTLDCDCCKDDGFKALNDVHYCKKKKSLIAEVCEEVMNARIKEKKKLKALKEGTVEYTNAFARQYALKILLNSVYGYLGYARSRWYSRKVMESIYGFVRKYILDTIEFLEKNGFPVIYADTDGVFVRIPEGKTRKELEALAKKINESLPEPMELELDKYFRRGIFVTKKMEGEKGAKKKYALIDEKGAMKIVGFEYVRRDWCNLAKETQRKVLKVVLEEGRKEKAIDLVKKVIDDLKKGIIGKKDLIILTQIQKPLSRYESIGPHIAAALKAVKRGKKITTGMIIGYIVTKTGKSISDKAFLEEFVKEGDYDADYYINNQVLPAVEKIMLELGYSREDLVHGGKQQKLF